MENHDFSWENPLFLWPFNPQNEELSGIGVYPPGSPGSLAKTSCGRTGCFGERTLVQIPISELWFIDVYSIYIYVYIYYI